MAQNPVIIQDVTKWKIYPETNRQKPELPSPFAGTDGLVYVIAETMTEAFAIIPVTLQDHQGICVQHVIDSLDFPTLAATGLHSEEELSNTLTITGRPVGEISKLGKPGMLSSGGFMAADENILDVIRGDNRIVDKMGLTHPELASPLFHVLNMMDWDLRLDRWNMARHQWENIRRFYYNGRTVFVEAEDTKGGQQSIFNDGITGGFYIRLWRALNPDEAAFLDTRYPGLSKSDRASLISKLSEIHTGEMQPQYIMRYGFYEGHTFWRTDPIAIAFIFGLRTLEELENAFPGALFDILNAHYNSD